MLNAARQDYVNAAVSQLSYAPLLILLSKCCGRWRIHHVPT